MAARAANPVSQASLDSQNFLPASLREGPGRYFLGRNSNCPLGGVLKLGQDENVVPGKGRKGKKGGGVIDYHLSRMIEMTLPLPALHQMPGRQSLDSSRSVSLEGMPVYFM